MIKFESEELRNNLIEELKFVEKTFFKLDNLLYWDDGPCDLKQLLLEQFEFDDEIIIDGNTLITLHPDKTDDLEIYEEVSIHDFFIIMEAYRTINKIDSEKCISPNEALYVIDVSEKDYLMDQLFSSDFNGFENDIAVFSTDYKGKEVRCSIVHGITLFGLKVLELREYSKYFPPVTYQDYFIKITGENLTNKDFDEIVNAYIFELSACDVINLCLSYRPQPEDFEDEETEEFLNQTQYMRTLLCGKGIDEIIKIYNEALKSFDTERKIIQYTKVIEFVSQTVIRMEKTERIQCKLSSLRSLKSDANFIKELELAFDDFKDKYSKDSEAIKSTIFRCCDIEDICDLAPKYLKKIRELKKLLGNQKANRVELLEAAKTELAQSISDTRNAISHAKANYTPKGKECPDEEMDYFLEMVRVVAVQVIKWYANIHESQRITASN